MKLFLTGCGLQRSWSGVRTFKINPDETITSFSDPFSSPNSFTGSQGPLSWCVAIILRVMIITQIYKAIILNLVNSKGPVMVIVCCE